MRSLVWVTLASGLLLTRQEQAPAVVKVESVPLVEERLPSPVWALHKKVLEPFQLVEGFVTQEPDEINEYISLVQQKFVKTVCETGFNAGHSSLLWLLANPDVKVYSFDLGQYGYTLAAADFIEKQFPGRFMLTKGNSMDTVPQFVVEHPEVRCDLVIVDGGHDVEVARADLLHLGAMASSISRVVVDDTPCGVSWCYGPGVAWQEAVQQNRVAEVKTQAMGQYRGFVVGEFRHHRGPPSPVWNTDSLSLVTKLVQSEGYSHGYAINLGAGDGKEGMPGLKSTGTSLLDPVYPLYQNGFDGIAVEGNAAYLPMLEQNLPAKVHKKIAFATPQSVPQLLKEVNAPTEPTYFKNDLDGYDCAVDYAFLKAGYRPKLLQLEVNPEIPWPIAFGVQYSDKFSPKLGEAGFYGCSLKLTASLVGAFGYELVAVGSTHDAFFARKDEREKMGVPVLDGGAASAELLKCCNPHHFGLGVAESWAEASAELDAQVLLDAMKPAVHQSCVATQGANGKECNAPYTLGFDATEYVANVPL